MMERQTTIQKYFYGLEIARFDEIIRLFVQDATVHSPLYGKLSASRFYKQLLADTQISKIVLKNIFFSQENRDCMAAHIVYSWTIKDGSRSQFECVEIFDFEPDSDKIRMLTTIYDTYWTRQRFEKIHTKS